MNFSYFGGMASNSSEPEYKVAPAPKNPFIGAWTWGDITLTAQNDCIEFDDTSGGSPGRINENEVRRLHSFLSQWLEKNQKDYF